MHDFQANRLSGGNRLFPAKISIDDFGVTLKIPGVFSGEEKSLGFHQISSVKIDTPMLGFSKITFDTIGWDRIVAEGFEKDDAALIKQLVQRGIASARSGQQGGGHLPTGAFVNQIIDPVALATAKAEQARIELESKKHEGELALRRRQQDEEEAKSKRKRADELRSQGKTVQAVFVEFGMWIGIGVAVISIVGFVGFSIFESKSTAREGAVINQKLEAIEDQVRLAIEAGDRDRAMDLVSQLVHPLHEQWEDQSKWDSWKGFPYYDDLWSQKREGYKKDILALRPQPHVEQNSAATAAVINSDPLSNVDTPTVAPSIAVVSEASVYYMIQDPDGYSNLRVTPGGGIIRKVLPDERFELVTLDSGYARVRLTDGTSGYIHASRVVKAADN